MALLIICMILAVTDGVCKWGFGIKLSKLRSELAELRVDRERVGGERAKLETESNYLNVQREEHSEQCRNLSRRLSDIEAEVEKLEAEEKISRNLAAARELPAERAARRYPEASFTTSLCSSILNTGDSVSSAIFRARSPIRISTPG